MKKFLFFVSFVFCFSAGLICFAQDNSADEVKAYMESRQIRKVTDYLYTAEYDEYKYADAQKGFDLLKQGAGLCSVMRKGNLQGRNLDSNYDDTAYFVLRASNTDSKHTSLGMASISGLTRDMVENGYYCDFYKVLPYYTFDGINDAGLAVTVCSVYGTDGVMTTGTNPAAPDLYLGAVVRYLLDNAGDVDEAVMLLRRRNLHGISAKGSKREYHFMISDDSQSVVVEFKNNKITVGQNAKVMTNYYLTDLSAKREMKGIERQDLLEKYYEAVKNQEMMMNLFRKVWYSKAYNPRTKPFWYSEFADDEDADRKVKAYYRNRYRGDGSMHTAYTSIYDMKKLTLTVMVQEKGEAYSFAL